MTDKHLKNAKEALNYALGFVNNGVADAAPIIQGLVSLAELEAQQASGAVPVDDQVVGRVYHTPKHCTVELNSEGRKLGDGAALYRSPQPPKAVPDSMEWNQATGRDGKMYSDGWNDCRRAMLKGQEGE